MDLETKILYSDYDFARLLTYYVLDCDFFKFVSNKIPSNVVLNAGVEDITLKIKSIMDCLSLDLKIKLISEKLSFYEKFV